MPATSVALITSTPPVAPTPSRVPTIRDWFDLPKHRPRKKPVQPARVELLMPRKGDLLLITGPSGAGKTRLLRTLRQRLDARGGRVIDPTAVSLPQRPVIDCFPGLSIEVALELLGRVGLAEAWTYLQPARRLSVGQTFRLRLALALAQLRAGPEPEPGPPVLMIDEFAAALDRVTAAVVARALRRQCDTGAVGAIVATSHDDLLRALRPDTTVRCDFTHYRVDRTERVARYP